jgi:thiol-disulfide isomerase/thioredoxin
MIKLKSTQEFYEAVENNKLSIVYFYTKWCPDCFVIKPALPRLEKDYSSITFYSFDRDKDINLARHLEIFGIPSFLMFKDGDEIGRYVDKRRKSYIEVKAFIDDILAKE